MTLISYLIGQTLTKMENVVAVNENLMLDIQYTLFDDVFIVFTDLRVIWLIES